jgi:pimeloyl-ACP methyl ester carboxylesterase
LPNVEADGIRLWVEEHGAGDAILGIHGTSSSAIVWQEAAERLARLGRAIVYDRRGCSRSERPDPYETSVEQHVRDAAALLGVLDAAPAVVIGRSYGGAVALGLALRHPELVRALVLLEPGDLEIDGAREPWDEAMRRAVEEAAATEPGRAAEAMFRTVLGDETWEAWPPEFQALAAANSPSVIAEVRGAKLAVSSAELVGIRVPTLLVAGEDSPAGFRETSDRIAASIPGARTELIGGGHLIDPGAPVILSFIGGVLGPG